MERDRKKIQWQIGLKILGALLIFAWTGPAAATEGLWLKLTPTADLSGPCCPLPEAFPPDKQKSAPQTPPGKPAGRQSRRGGPPSRFESEHRPLPVRTYYLDKPAPGATLAGLLLKADGSLTEVKPEREGNSVKLSFRAEMGEGAMHGPNNLYAIEQRLKGDTLVVRSAKWCTLHHNCGWGHDHKFDKERLAARSSDRVPLEIVVHDLWDFNFHSRVMSGDELILEVLHLGKPASGAKVRVTTENGWSREFTANDRGQVQMRLIGDLTPDSWSRFNRNQQGELLIEASYLVDEPGSIGDSEYRHQELSATFPWRYYPARRGYTSLAYGLLLVTLGLGFSSLGIYIHRGRRRRPRREIFFDEE